MERGGSSNGKGVARSGGAGKDKAAVKNGEDLGMKRDPDLYMPISSVNRIMQRVLPEHATVTDDAKEAIQECVSEFIAFITREANHRCNSEYRRTVTPNDVLSTMAALGFDDYVEPLTVFLNKHRAAQDPSRTPLPLPLPVRRHPAPPVASQPPTQMDFFPPPPPAPAPAPAAPAPAAVYVPSPPMISDDYFDLPQMRDYFQLDMNHGGGDGSEFDPFN